MAGFVKKTKDATINAAKQTLIMAEDGISDAAQLSPKQIEQIQREREKYLKENQNFEQDKLNTIDKCLGAIHTEIMQAHLPQIYSLYKPVAWSDENFFAENRIRFFNITKWTVDPKENSLDKLINVYQVLSEEYCSIALIYTRKISGCTVMLAVENYSERDQPAIANGLNRRFQSAFFGNFPGAELSQTYEGIPCPLRENLSGCSIASVSNLASEKSENFISQSIEKLLDGIVPRTKADEYSIILLACPAHNLRERQNRLCRLYTELSPYSTWQTSRNSSNSLSQTAIASMSGNLGFGIPAIVNIGSQFGRSAIASHTAEQSHGITETHTDYAIKHTQELIESQIKRMDQCAALGMWDFAAYVFSPNYDTAKNVAHMYLSLTQGEESYMEQAAINIWEPKKAAPLLPWLRALRHPEFVLNPELVKKIPEYLIYPPKVTATTALSGKELARALNFPRKSVGGLPVYECVPFGREVVQYTPATKNQAVSLGHIYHMRRQEIPAVQLNKDSLTAHTFITGSTGVGKSNTIYTLLDKLCLQQNNNIHFLVIEPAKGEYKESLGGYPTVQVYGTNPYKTPLLRLNPFSFPEDTHVLEHIGRLIELFNACWPMYAAMPAVLKASVEQAYKACGWSLYSSTCVGNRKFPTFHDVAKALPTVVDSKGFSSDTQGDYKGALLTRLESLTNGINGQVLCSYDELTDECLFDQNVIIDLSRIGSSETKSLLMGILVLKLQEYRMAQRANEAITMNNSLQHITVLEEAHNLLRRTSPEQSQESSNLQGKSVEMLTNAIAEMRTYGEGFIIADQSPGLLDMAVIRNTNTKIILRLPEQSDRMLAGKAAGLNDDQIIELSRLDTGVAAVYQNHWLEPVLCKIDHFNQNKAFSYRPPTFSQDNFSENICQILVQNTSDGVLLEREGVDRIKTWINQQNTGREVKRLLTQILVECKVLSTDEQRYMLYCLVHTKQLIEDVRRTTLLTEESQAAVDKKIMESLSVSLKTAREIRSIVFLYAADNVRHDEHQYFELKKIGGII